jgi:hypothetical protein
MSPTNYMSPFSKTSATSRSAALAEVEDRNKAKGLMESSYNRMLEGGSSENLSPEMKRILDLRRAVAMQEAEDELEIQKKFGPLKRQLAREEQEEEVGYSQFRQRNPMIGTKYGMADFRGIGKSSGMSFAS